jgi:hypothetical protein
MADAPKFPIDWSIIDLDTNQFFFPQLPMSDGGVSLNVGSRIVSQERFGEQDSIIHYTGGSTRSFSFSAMLYARNTDESDTVEDLLDDLTQLTEKDEDLGRIHICLFRYGVYLEETVLIDRVDPQIVSVDRNGAIREVRLSISMLRYVPFSQTQIDPTKPTKESFLQVVSQGEQMWEQIARRFYGDPMMGDRLRKRHPQYAFSAPIGAVVKVPAKSVILKEVVQPSFHAFNFTDEDAVANYERILADRNARQVVEVT